MAGVVTQFWPIIPHKSDGREEIAGKDLALKNGPNAQQLDQTPNAQGQADYYRLIAKDEPKHIDWRKKLGGMLLRELGGSQYESKWNQCILLDLPEGYRLFEHIKSKADGSTKTHSGGGHDRQDAYLYGHPKGPKKRFRSPADFFPHLLWLSTDDTNDYNNCTCKLCCPVQLEADKPVVKAEAKSDSPAIQKEDMPTSTGAASLVPVPRHPIVQIPLRNPSISSVNAQSPSVKSASTPQRVKPPASLIPTPLPQPRSIDQQVDGQYNKFVCRTGEVVWFHRESTKAWGLGLVIRRWIPRDGSSARAHQIQPLSHPYLLSATEVITSDDKLKPWLAWSAPSCTYSYLQQHPNMPYHEVDWNALMSGRYGPGNAEVDASILAAKSVDATYTLFERLKTTTNSQGHEERSWNCLYFGAEKIWNGDPVRLRIGGGTDVMVVTSIIERITPNAPSTTTSFSSSIQLVGDVYTYATLPAQDASKPPEPLQVGIPIRMREDMKWRNKTLLPTTRTIAYWKLIATQSRLDLSSIKGRWYETSLVFPDFFHKAIKNNDGGNGVWMNTRGDASGLGAVVGTRKDVRVEAFGSAVPKHTILVDGLDPVEEAEHGQTQPHSMQGLDMASTDHAAFALDDFMNLDSMEDGNMDFGDNFHFS